MPPARALYAVVGGRVLDPPTSVVELAEEGLKLRFLVLLPVPAHVLDPSDTDRRPPRALGAEMRRARAYLARYSPQVERFMYACGAAGIGLVAGLVFVLVVGDAAWVEALTLKAKLGSDDPMLVFTTGGAVLGLIVGLIRWDG